MVSDDSLRILLADLILVVHFSFVAFVVAGFFCILPGRFVGWQWIYRRMFRFLHLGAIAIVVIQSWFGQLCFLTIWENELRQSAGQAGYTETFVQDWLHRLLFFEADFLVFVVVYSVFGGAVLATLIIDRTHLFGR